MAYTLEQFAADCHDALAADPGSAGREAIRDHLVKLLADPEFVAEHLGADAGKGKRVLHHDPDTGFYINAHGTDQGNRVGAPHNHGSSWAVYGQASGVTEMTVWHRKDDGSRAGHAELDVERTFRLDPGNAALFDTGIIHSTAHPQPARWVRVTGTDFDTIARSRFDPEARTEEPMNPGI